MDIAITFSPQAPEIVLEEVHQIVSQEVDGGVTRLRSQKGPALLVHLNNRSLQSTLELATRQNACCAINIPTALVGTHHSLTARTVDDSVRPENNSRAPTSTAEPAGSIAVRDPPSGNALGISADDVSPAQTVLLAISCLESVKVTDQLLHILQQHGIDKSSSSSSSKPLEDASPDDPSSSSSSSSSGGGSGSGIAAQPTDSPTATPVTNTAAAAPLIVTPNSAGSRELQQQQQQQQQHEALLPLLQRCGIATGLLPVHDPSAMYRLRMSTLTSLLAPVDEIRMYFGSQIGFYFSFLNAMTIWLLAPAAVSMYLLWAVHATASSSSSSNSDGSSNTAAAAGGSLSSPLTPVLVVFHLIWSVVGLKLWQRQESGFNYRWHTSSVRSKYKRSVGSSSSSRSSGSSKLDVQTQPAATLAATVGATAAQAEAAAVLGVAAAAPAGPADHSATLPGATLHSAAAAAAPAAAVVGRSSVVGPHDGEVAGIGGAGLTAASLEVPAAAGVRREYAGRWRVSPVTGQLELLSPVPQQLLRLALSASCTMLLLLLGAEVLLGCLNLQGYIAPTHSMLFNRRLAGLSQPGGTFSKDSGFICSQVPLAVRSVATVAYSSCVFGPAIKLLTGFENHRTVEGFATSMTAKQAALQLLFTFGPVTYVGLAGAGAAAARAEVAAFFKIELLRRIAMELVLPWIIVCMAAARQQQQQQGQACADTSRGVTATETAVATASVHGPNRKGPTASPAAAAPVVPTAAAKQATLDLSKPKYDAFADFWDLNRDLGYLLLFAAVYPAAAPLCLLYSLVKSKQDCLKLLVAYQRPVPLQLKGIGSWNVVLTVMVFASVITSVFLSGLTTGQLVQLLPAPVVPEVVRTAVLTASSNRPASSTEGSSFGGKYRTTAATTVGPVLQASSAASTLQQISSSAAMFDSGQVASQSFTGQRVAEQATVMDAAKMCLNPDDAEDHRDGGFRHFGGLGYSAAKAICRASDVVSSVMGASGQNPHMQSLLELSAQRESSSVGGRAVAVDSNVGAGETAAADHLLLLFVLEHVMVIVMLLVYWCIPSEPAIVQQAAKAKQLQQDQLLMQVQELQSQQGGEGTTSLLKVNEATPTMVHTNPLFDKSNVPTCAAAAAALS